MLRILFLWIFTIAFTGAFAQNFPSESLEDVLYKRGIDLIDAGNLTSARQVFEDYIDQYPNGNLIPEAKYNIAKSALKLYNKDGEALVKRFINEYPSHPKAASAYYELGKFYFKSKNYPNTTKFLKKTDLSQLSVKHKNETLFMLGYGYFNQKKFDDALIYFNQLKVRKNEYTIASAYYSGYIEYEKDLYTLAEEDLKIAEKDEEFKREVPYMLAGVFYKAGRYEELISYAKPLVDSDTRYSNEHLINLALGESYYQKNNFKSAEDYYNIYRKAVRNSIEPEVRYRMAFTKYNLKEYQQALKDFKQVATEDKEISAYASYYAGVIYLQSNDKRSALNAFEIVSQNKYNRELREDGHYQLAKIKYDLSEGDRGISTMEEYLKNYPSGKYKNEISEMLSNAYLSSNDYKRALKYIDGLTRRTPKIDQAYQKAAFYLGTQYFNMKDYRRAVDMFAKSLAKPFDKQFVIKANFWTAEAYSIGLRWGEAINYYQSIVSNTNNKGDEYYVKARYGLGYAYFNTQQYYKARIQFREYVLNTKASRYQYDAYVRLADCYYVEKDYTSAKKYYDEALSKSRADEDYIFVHLGIINMLEEQYEASHNYFERVIAKGQTSRYFDNALFQDAQLHFNKSDYKMSITQFTRLIDEKPKSRFVPNALMRRASAYFNTGMYGKASEDYIRLLTDFSSHKLAGDALLPLQDVLTLMNKSSEFDGYLAMYKEANPERNDLEEVEFEALKNKYFNREYRASIEGFTQFIENYPNDPRGVEATYYIADAYYRLEEYDNAKSEYYKLLESSSFWKYPSVVEKVAELEYLERNYEQSLKFYSELIKVADNKRQQNIALGGKMMSYYNLAEYDSTILYARKVLQSGNVNVSSQNEASLMLGKSFFAKGDYNNAKDELLNTINSAKDESGAEAQYLLGEIFYLQEQHKQSIEFLIDLNTNFPSYQKWVGKAFLLISDNYVAMEDYFQAKGTLNSLIKNFPGEEVKEQAQVKLIKLEEIEEELRIQDSIRREKALMDSVKTNKIDSTDSNENN